MRKPMEQCPNLVWADYLAIDHPRAKVDGNWVAARHEGLSGLFLVKRLYLAWKVFTGEYDALRWYKQ